MAIVAPPVQVDYSSAEVMLAHRYDTTTFREAERSPLRAWMNVPAVRTWVLSSLLDDDEPPVGIRHILIPLVPSVLSGIALGSTPHRIRTARKIQD
jgi:hypothetical protein